MEHVHNICNFHTKYTSTSDFENKFIASVVALEKCVQDPQNTELEAIFAISLLYHTKRIALRFAWDYHSKIPQTYGNYEITNDSFTLSFDDLQTGKIVFIKYYCGNSYS
jgi:hypothetical protein